ncbi:hypothetical protein [Aquidulcibacter sp.]|uniref:cell division protein FtsL n=1 Tax=Aquidulcibacter sp. TaxID=2052990 RepID=UPI0025BA9C97|nr:hypothetical protein [Aquidulcibacter sp.]MCA3697961.1 hypothetical protein [Aquidulcibacter sp.]
MTLTRTHLFGFVGLVALAFALYWAKAEAQAVREKVLVLQEEVDTERRAVRTLEAELTWVERPDRLEAAATRKLGLVPMTAERIATLDDIDQIAPLRAAKPNAADAQTLAPTDAEQKPTVSVADKPKAVAAKPAPITTVVGR